MGTTVANPVIRLDFRGANFFKGLLSAKNRFRSFFRDIGKTTKRGMRGSNNALIGGLSVSKGVLIGFLSFATVSIFAKLFNVVKDVFTKIPKLIAQSGIEMESALVEVVKVVDLSAEQIEELRKNLVNFARVTPTTTKQLLNIAAAGARMGVALDEGGNVAADATKRLTDFAISVAKADVAIEDLDTDEIGRGIGKLLNLFGLSVKQTDNLTSSLNLAAQNSAAFASEILNATTRAAGAANQFKFTAAEAIAVSATLIELGRTAEITGSSFERLLNIASKTENFEKFGKLLGITGDEFKKMIDRSPLEVLRAIFKELSKTRTITEANKVLTDLFGTNVRLLGSVRGLTQGTKLLDKNLKFARKGFKEATSVNKEFNLVAKTTAGRLETLRGSFIAAFQDLFVKIRPAILMIIDGLFDVSKAFTVLTENEDFVSFIRGLIEDFGNLAKNVGLFFVKLISTFTKADKLVGDQGFFAVLSEQVKSFTKSLIVEDFKLFIEVLNLLKIVLEGVASAFEKIASAFAKTKRLFEKSQVFIGEFFAPNAKSLRILTEGVKRISKEEKKRQEATKKEEQKVNKLFNLLKNLGNEEKKRLEVKKKQTTESEKQVQLAKEETVEVEKQRTVAQDILEARRKNIQLSEQVKKDLEERRRNRREAKRRPPLPEAEAQDLIRQLKREETEKFERRSRIILDPKTRKEFEEKQRARERGVTSLGPGGKFGGLRRGIEEGGGINRAKRGEFGVEKFRRELTPITKKNQKTFEQIKKGVESTTENTKITADEIEEIAVRILRQQQESQRLAEAAKKLNNALAGTRPRASRGQ